MENGENKNVFQPQHSFSTELGNGGEHSHSDIMARRMKNRERQRRYRARKRLEQDSMKPDIISEPTLLLMAPQPISEKQDSFVENKSRRDWKKDARRAPVSNGSEASSSESQSSGLSPKAQVESLQGRESCPNGASVQGASTCRRDWKAEARKRKA